MEDLSYKDILGEDRAVAGRYDSVIETEMGVARNVVDICVARRTASPMEIAEIAAAGYTAADARMGGEDGNDDAVTAGGFIDDTYNAGAGDDTHVGVYAVVSAFVYGDEIVGTVNGVAHHDGRNGLHIRQSGGEELRRGEGVALKTADMLAEPADLLFEDDIAQGELTVYRGKREKLVDSGGGLIHFARNVVGGSEPHTRLVAVMLEEKH